MCGLEVGDCFEVTESNRVRIPEGRHFCLYALQAVLPLLPAKQRRLPGRGLARAGQSRLLPRPGRARRDADRADRRADARDRGADLARELGLGLQSDRSRRSTSALARRAEEAGFDVDLGLPRPALPAGDRPAPAHGARDRARAARAGGAQPLHAPPVRDRGPGRGARPAPRAAARTSGSRRARGSTGSASTSGGRSRGCARPSRSCARCSPATRSGFAGELFTLAPGHGLAYEPARRRVPLMIGTWGPRTAALAGEVADEVKIGGCANPEMVPVDARVDRERRGGDRRRLRHGRGRGRRLGARARARRRSGRTSRSSHGSIRHSSRPAPPPLERFCSPGRRRRSPRRHELCSTRARSASSSARRRGSRPPTASSCSATACCHSCAHRADCPSCGRLIEGSAYGIARTCVERPGSPTPRSDRRWRSPVNESGSQDAVSADGTSDPRASEVQKRQLTGLPLLIVALGGRALRAGGVRALLRRRPSPSEAPRRRLRGRRRVAAADRGREAVLAEDDPVLERVGRACRDRSAEDRRSVRRRPDRGEADRGAGGGRRPAPRLSATPSGRRRPRSARSSPSFRSTPCRPVTPAGPCRSSS